MRLAADGAALLLTARSRDALDAVAEEARALGAADVAVRPGSVASVDDVEDSAEFAESRWGRLDVLVNSAGISPVMRPLAEMPDELVSEIIDVNLGGLVRSCRAAMGLMGEGGSIVNLSSVHATSGMAGLSAYSATKGAVEALTRTLALEGAPRGIRVNAVAPGYIETDMTQGLRDHDHWRGQLLDRIPLGRFGTPEEVAGVVSFLAGSAAAYVTGTTITIDGGWTAQ